MIVHPPLRRKTSMRYKDAQVLRRRALEAGVEPWRVASTPDAHLHRLTPTQLRLVDDAEVAAEFDRAILDRTPRESWSCLIDTFDQTEDEIESTRYFLRQRAAGLAPIVTDFEVIA